MQADPWSWNGALGLSSGLTYLVVATALAAAYGVLRWMARGSLVTVKLTQSASTAEGPRTLLVMVHGMGGYARFQSAVRLAMQAIPRADVL